MAPMMGMMTSPTSELTMLPNAAPMITPTARSMTLPRMANFLKSSSIANPPGMCRSSITRASRVKSFRRLAGRNDSGCFPPHFPFRRSLIDQARMHHGVSNRRLRLVRQCHHGQSHRVGAFAEYRKRVFGGRRVGLDEQVLMQRHQLVLQLERSGIVAAQAGALELGAQPRRHV